MIGFRPSSHRAPSAGLPDCTARHTLNGTWGACEIDAFNLPFRDVTMTGFWLAKLMRSMSFEQIRKMYDELASRLINNIIHADIEAGYPLEQVCEAMAHAKREARGGKV